MAVKVTMRGKGLCAATWGIGKTEALRALWWMSWSVGSGDGRVMVVRAPHQWSGHVHGYDLIGDGSIGDSTLGRQALYNAAAGLTRKRWLIFNEPDTDSQDGYGLDLYVDAYDAYDCREKAAADFYRLAYNIIRDAVNGGGFDIGGFNLEIKTGEDGRSWADKCMDYLHGLSPVATFDGESGNPPAAPGYFDQQPHFHFYGIHNYEQVNDEYRTANLESHLDDLHDPTGGTIRDHTALGITTTVRVDLSETGLLGAGVSEVEALASMDVLKSYVYDHPEHGIDFVGWFTDYYSPDWTQGTSLFQSNGSIKALGRKWRDIDNEVLNGYFEENHDGWTEEYCDAVIAGSGDVGNCIRLKNSAQGNWPILRQPILLPAGYHWFQFAHKNGNAQGMLRIGTTPHGDELYTTDWVNDANWTRRDSSFELKSDTTIYITLWCGSQGLNDYTYFDEVIMRKHIKPIK